MVMEFVGAARTVTGSRTLCHHGKSSVMVDCGMFQGPKAIRQRNWQNLDLPDTCNGVILTHAHIDHSGLVPLLVKAGYDGPIYVSPATLELCRVLLLDSARLQEEDARFANKTGYSRHKPALPLYTVPDVHRAMKQFRAVSRDKWTRVSADLEFRLCRSGHILGSSFVELASSNHRGKKIALFSGDLGNGRSVILKPPTTDLSPDVLVLESTYGDRIQSKVSVEDDLAFLVHRVCDRGGVMVIPAFSVGRTQEVLELLRRLISAKKIPDIPVYVDSPMANATTEIFLKFQDDHLEGPILPWKFNAVQEVEDSKALNQKHGPMIIISAAGMLTGGRIMHHLKNRLPDPTNLILFVGYQARETKGRLLQEGIQALRIHHQEIPVRAEIVTLEGLSAHADQDELVAWVRALRKRPEKVFLNHGDNLAPDALAKRLKDELGLSVEIPESGQEFEVW